MRFETKRAPLINPRVEREKRERLAQLRVLVADRNTRTATLVKRILFSFGFRHMDVVTSGAAALELLRTEPFDLIITEWNMEPVDGIELVRGIRLAKDDNRIRRDIPIIMLTAHTEIVNVETARDAGITEFVAKPFSARTMSTHIIQIIDNPRAFVETPEYVGPCRRRRRDLSPEEAEKRLPPELHQMLPEAAHEKITPPDETLREKMMPFTASEILDKETVQEAQEELVKAEGDVIEWAREYIEELEKAYTALCAQPDNTLAMQLLRDAAYAITVQAGTFGYDLGCEVGDMLIDYINNHGQTSPKTLIVIRKHIDTVNVVFRQNIKDHGQQIGRDLVFSLRRLILKLG